MGLLRRDWTGFLPHSLPGRLLRLPFRLIPDFVTLPILTGPLKGVKWVVASSLTSCWLGTYELSLQKMAVKYIHHGMTVCDVGAHAGFFTMFFSRLVGDTGFVHAFEPYPVNNANIKRHIDLNDVRNVRLWQIALSDTTGYAGFRPSKHSSMGTVTSETDASIMVGLATLDSFVDDQIIAPPDVVKVDIEGHELQLLQGAKGTIARYSPILFIEFHSTEKKASCHRFLENYGYSVTNIESVGNDPEHYSRMVCALPRDRTD